MLHLKNIWGLVIGCFVNKTTRGFVDEGGIWPNVVHKRRQMM